MHDAAIVEDDQLAGLQLVGEAELVIAHAFVETPGVGEINGSSNAGM